MKRERITPDLWDPADNGCWIWKGSRKTKTGYCTVWIGGREFSAHRAIYEQEVGPIPEGLQIDHLCRNPSCVNPEHLEPVSAAENVRRSARTPLTYDTVALIRADPLSTRKAAAKYGVSQQTISSVRRGHTWA